MANLIFCLQLSPVDASAAVELARLIADIEDGEPCQCKPAWLVSYRRDTPVTRVHDIESQLCNYFDSVWVAQAREHASGWPAGPNALWRSTMADVYNLHKDGRIDAAGALTFEADCVPFTVDWIDRLDAAYGEQTKPVMGSLQNSLDYDFEAPKEQKLRLCMGNLHTDHINGNAIFPVTLARDWPNMMQAPMGIAWDYYHKDFLLENATDTPLITQLYKRKALSKEEWNGTTKHGVRPALLHGIKDGSAREFARADLVHGRKIRKTTSAMTVEGRNFSEIVRARGQGV